MKTQQLNMTREPSYQDDMVVTVEIAGAKVSAAVAASAEARTKGLSGSPQLKENHGMLFVASLNETPVFTMRGMTYPIDIIWISEGKVSEIRADVQPEPDVPDDQLSKYQPAVPVDEILETQAGWAAKHGVQPGTAVHISLS